MRETGNPPPLSWSCAFPATPAQAREARRSLARLLDGHPAADDAALCLSELAANATMHSRSRDGGYFTVRAQLSDDRVRVEVHDQGGPWTCAGHADGQHGRGLLIVSQLARAWGRTGDSATGWTVWFECAGAGHAPGNDHD
jgi:anti-sigma regulatory factor (Ser/Thr protein kinase)